MKIVNHTYSDENRCLADAEKFLERLNGNQIRGFAVVYFNRNDPTPKHAYSFAEIDRLNMMAMLGLLERDLGSELVASDLLP